MKNFLNLLSDSNNLIISTDDKETIISIAGTIPLQQPQNSDLKKFLPGELYEHAQRALDKSQKKGHLIKETLPLRDEKKERWLVLHAVKCPIEGRRVLFIQDITKNKELETLNKQLSTAIEQSAHSVIITDAKGFIIYVNQHFLDISRYSLAEVIGKTPTQVVGSGVHDKHFFTEAWAKIERTGNWSGEICNKKKTGELYWENANISAVKNEKDEIVNFISIQTDITSQKEIIWELEKSKTYSEKLNRILGFALEDAKKAREESENANKAKSDFLANMSHEIRTPMNSLIGMMDLLRETPLNEPQKKFLDIMDRSSAILLNLINDILDLSRIEAGKVEINNAFFGLEDVIDTITDMMKLKAHQKGLELLLDIQTPINLIIQSDAIRLRQIVLNLVSNAIKFTDHGHIRLRVKTEQRQEKLHLIIEVADTGIGIPEEKLQHLFKKFHQLSNSPDKLYGGSGLGLVISKRIIEKMGGEIEVKTSQDQGATFTVNIPLHTFKHKQVSLEKPLYVSVAHVQPEHRSIVAGQLKSLAPLVKITDQQALEDSPDCIIADHPLNDEDFEGIRSLLNSTDHSKTKILLCLSHEQRKLFLGQTGPSPQVTIVDKPLKRRELLTFLMGEHSHSHEESQLNLEDEIARRVHLPLKILLVDDSEDNRILMLNFLKKIPATIEVAENGIAALQKSKETCYDITFMDMQMPVMDGYRAMAEIRQDDKTQSRDRRYIVALSAFAFSDEIEKSYNAGCDYYVTKPIKKQKLLETILLYIKSREILELR